MSNFDIDNFLRKAVEINGSDIHLAVGEHPAVRKDGNICKIDMPILTSEDLHEICEKLMPENIKSRLSTLTDIDFAYEIEGCSRFRVNVSRQLGDFALAIRVISYEIKKITELFLPEIILNFANFNNGLVLITGPTGSGKSTTIASLIDYINESSPKHIITLEDPIEYIFRNKKSIISQRQLHVDTTNFYDGIKFALRQDPDVILIGEIRDRETLSSALKAAETGHLVLATLHTNSAAETVNRIINMYTPEDRPFLIDQLSSILRGVISQKLLPLVSGNGRRPASEVMTVTPTVRDLIKKGEIEQIYDLAKHGGLEGFISMNESLYSLYKENAISSETATWASDNQNEIRQMLRGVYHGTNGNF